MTDGADPLTGLTSRAHFIVQIDRAIQRSLTRGTLIAVVCVDLDRFKAINESLGIEIGDHLLVAVAQRLEASCRQPCTTARLGGDEFAVMFEDVDDAAGALVHAEHVRAAIAVPYEISGQRLHTSATAGVAISSRGPQTAADLLGDAAVAMYRAKELGKDRAELFNQELRARAAHLMHVESSLREALDRGEFVVHYQPEVDIRTASITAVEALVRWQPPGGPLVYPDAFISVAEETGLIHPIGRWVLAEACRQTARWGAIPGAPPLTMWVNLSARQLGRRDIVGVVAASIADAGLHPTQLGLEITETALLADMDAVVSTLHQLARVGVRIAIDDFGTGYSSLANLKRLPVSIVKVDRTFVTGLADNSADTSIVAAIVTMARALGIAVVAEGVETERQLGELRALGCDLAQGYLFSKALPAAAMEALLCAPDRIHNGATAIWVPQPREPADVRLTAQRRS